MVSKGQILQEATEKAKIISGVKFKKGRSVIFSCSRLKLHCHSWGVGKSYSKNFTTYFYSVPYLNHFWATEYSFDFELFKAQQNGIPVISIYCPHQELIISKKKTASWLSSYFGMEVCIWSLALWKNNQQDSQSTRTLAQVKEERDQRGKFFLRDK